MQGLLDDPLLLTDADVPPPALVIDPDGRPACCHSPALYAPIRMFAPVCGASTIW
jgi:hypothetical protein